MGKIKKTAVMYGAGNIGRGFIGQVLHDSGYEVVFIDVNSKIIDSINERGGYTQLLVDGDNVERREINNVRAVDGRDSQAVAREIADCEIMAVSVGAAVLPIIAPNIVAGIKLREKPLNILVCENLLHAPAVLRGYVAEYLAGEGGLVDTGFIGAAIGRMVPVMPESLKGDDPALIAVERFCFLPLDADAVVGETPELAHTEFCRPFEFYESRKLYIHNMGHAVTAYMGYLRGHEYIWQAVADNAVREKASAAMTAAASALSKKYGGDENELLAHVDDLLNRFGNKGLGDTVARVGGDPMRKLAPGDRLTGALELCKKQHISYEAILRGIAAALRFDAPNDVSAQKLQEQLEKRGERDFLCSYCALGREDADECVEIYNQEEI